MTPDVASPINRLLRGVSSRHVATIRDAWRDLLSGGSASTAAVLGKLDSASWSQKPQGPSGEYFAVLLAALHELDPDAFGSEVERLWDSALHPLHQKTLKLLQARAFESPVGHVVQDIPIYVADSVDRWQEVLETLTRWTQTKGLRLENVTRIDIIKEEDEQDYLGKYSLYFSGIILVWPDPSPSRIVSWLLARRAEHTFYHEVGHHVSGHLEGGSVAEQEAEANAYALKMMCRAYPAMNFAVYLLYIPAKQIVRGYRRLFAGQIKRKRPG